MVMLVSWVQLASGGEIMTFALLRQIVARTASFTATVVWGGSGSSKSGEGMGVPPVTPPVMMGLPWPHVPVVAVDPLVTDEDVTDVAVVPLLWAVVAVLETEPAPPVAPESVQ